MSELSAPLLDPEVMAAARAQAGDAPMLVALSGGGDSLALLVLLSDVQDAAALRAAIVDHGLRADSADEAKRAAAMAEALGVRAEVLTLSWPGGAKRSQAAARQGRLRALCEHARAIGATVVALGHNQDDQAETVWLRAERGSDWRGLAGMRGFGPAPVWPEGRGLFFVRPLLGARRAALREALRARGLVWIEDVSNENPAFARVRARRELADLESAGFDAMRLARLAAQMRPRADQLDAAAWRRIAAARFVRGEIDISAQALVGAAGQRAAAALIAAAGGAGEPPLAGEVGAALTRLAEGVRAVTLGGALLRRAPGRVSFGRDPGGVHGRADGAGGVAPLTLSAGLPAVWDGRLELTADEPGWRAEADPAGGLEPLLIREGAAFRLEEAKIAHKWLLQAHCAQILCQATAPADLEAAFTSA